MMIMPKIISIASSQGTRSFVKQWVIVGNQFVKDELNALHPKLFFHNINCTKNAEDVTNQLFRFHAKGVLSIDFFGKRDLVTCFDPFKYANSINVPKTFELCNQYVITGVLPPCSVGTRLQSISNNYFIIKY